MKHLTLQNTHTKLAVFFTLIVFLIVILLGMIFVSTKYFKERSRDVTHFVSQTNMILEEFGQELDILSLFNLEQERFDGDFTRRRSRGPKILPARVSYVILDGKNRVTQKKILQDIDFELLESDIFTPGVEIKSDVLIRRELLQNSVLGDRVILYMPYRMSRSDLLGDIGLYFFLALFLAAGLYGVGFLFVGRILRPVAANMDDMKDFIHNAGHEFKTPLAVMDSNLQILQAKNKADQQLVDESRDEIRRLNSLVEGLIHLSDISVHAERQPVSLMPEIASLLSEYKQAIDAKSIVVDTNYGDLLTVSAHPGYLRILLANVIENAIKYNVSGGQIHIYIKGGSLCIIDTGVGISDDEKQKIFDRFYQVNASRGSEGFGIGLSLVKKIADIYAWKIEVSDNEPRGTRWTIRFV